MQPNNSGRYPAIQDAYRAVVSQIARRLKRLGMEPLPGLMDGLDTTDQFAVAMLSDPTFLLGKPIAIVKLEGADQGCAFKFVIKLVAVQQILILAEGEEQAKIALAFVDLTPAGPGFSNAFPFPGIEPANNNWYQKMQTDFSCWYVVAIARTPQLLPLSPQLLKRKSRPTFMWATLKCLNGEPGASRTRDLWLRKPTLYPAELRAQNFKSSLSAGLNLHQFTNFATKLH